jgi:ABC-type glutathione transport system ATPase component
MWNSKLVILDEPTAALGVAQTEQVLELVRRLAEQGLAVVLISHNLHDIFETATRITVLRLGRNVGVYERATTTQQEVVQAITAGIPTKVSASHDAPGDRRMTARADVVAPGIGLPDGEDVPSGEPLATGRRQRPVRQPRRAPRRPRGARHHRLLRLHGDELLHRAPTS